MYFIHSRLLSFQLLMMFLEKGSCWKMWATRVMPLSVRISSVSCPLNPVHHYGYRLPTCFYDYNAV